jgi:uncharacterized iron-regulated protein
MYRCPVRAGIGLLTNILANAEFLMLTIFLIIIGGAQMPGDGEDLDSRLEGVFLGANADTVSIDQLAFLLAEYDLIFVGENHDAAQAHYAEQALLTSLYRADSNLVMGMEMFEQDVADILQSYLQGSILEDSFLSQSRPWPNYASDYRPLIEFAKQNAIPVVAANIPRRAASAVAKTGEISPEVVGPDSIYLPPAWNLDSHQYRSRFAATMQSMPHGSAMGQMNVDGLYRAQVLKDAAMAHVLEPYLDRRIIFFCGRFHSDYHLGIPYQLSTTHPEKRVAVISMIPGEEYRSLTAKERTDIGDYVYLY